MRMLVIFLLLASSAWGFVTPDYEKQVSESDAIAVVNITAIEHDRWEITLAPKAVSPLITIATGTVETCLKGNLPASLTIIGNLTTGKWLLFIKRKNNNLTTSFSLRVENDAVESWYGKEWKSTLRSGRPQVLGAGSRFRCSIENVCDEIREMVKAAQAKQNQ